MFHAVRSLTPATSQKVKRVGDVIALSLACCAASVRDGQLDVVMAAGGFAAATISWLVASRLLRQYDAANGRSDLGDVALTLVMVVGIALPLAIATAVVAPSAHNPAFRFAVTLAPLMVLLRLCLAVRKPWAPPVRDTLIVGVGPLGRLTGRELQESDAERRVMGYLSFSDETPSPRLRAPVLGSSNDLLSVLEKYPVDEVYFASTAAAHCGEVQTALQTCERLGIPFALPACQYRLGRAKADGGRAIADGYVHYSSVQLKPIQLWLKRAFDILASATALLFLSPLFAAVAIAIKATSRGPILFHQERVGLHGRTFHMLKFRSMVVNAEELKEALMAANEQSGPVFKMKRDPRITAVGRFIRKYSIDELAQLVNVLRGDMSIVGPRPPVPKEVAKYEAWQRRRLSVRPGLTCIWQVSGRNQIGFEDWMRLDMRYIDHWSLVWDFRLILATVPVVVTGRGAS